MRPHQLFKEPLLHFLVLGFALFAIFGRPTMRSNNKEIEVTRQTLVSFIRYKSKVLEPAQANEILNALQLEDLSNLIQEYVREEVLFREAVALGLESGDEIIRRRLVQKLELLAETDPSPKEPQAQELIEYYQHNRPDYQQPANITFSHVFIRASDQEIKNTQARATELLRTLRRANAGFRDATAYGEHFLYHTNYVKRTPETIAADFGARFSQATFSENAKIGKWTEPIISKHGIHLVFVVERTQTQIPPYATIQDRVRHDFMREKQRQSSELFIRQIQSKYRTIIDPELNAAGLTSP